MIIYDMHAINFNAISNYNIFKFFVSITHLFISMTIVVYNLEIKIIPSH